MSETNEQIVERLYELWNAGEDADELLDPEIEYVNPDDAVESGTRYGRAEWDRTLSEVRRTMGGMQVTLERTAATGERVAAIVSLHVSAPASGLETDLRQGHVWTIHEGRAVRFEWFNDPAAALRAIGATGPS